MDNATTGAVIADNTRSPRDTGINPDAIAISALKRQGFEQMSKALLKLIEYAIGELS